MQHEVYVELKNRINQIADILNEAAGVLEKEPNEMLTAGLADNCIVIANSMREQYGEGLLSRVSGLLGIASYLQEGNVESNTLINMTTEWRDSFIAGIKDGQYKLSFVLIIKNGADYIREWLEYHMLVGVEHFYVYDNDSVDNLEDILESYIRQNIVTYIKWPGEMQQIPAYNHALSSFRNETEYMAFIDDDEFVIPKQCDDIYETISGIIAKYESGLKVGGHAGGVVINWRLFGFGGHKSKPEGLVIENYLDRAEDDMYENVHVKTICNPRVVSHITNPHFVEYFDGYYSISEKGSYVPSAYFYDSGCELLQINHYYSKSEEELILKKRRGWAAGNSITESEDWLANRIEIIRDSWGVVHDECALRFVGQVKRRLEGINN